jgi:hypothetical protein
MKVICTRTIVYINAALLVASLLGGKVLLESAFGVKLQIWVKYWMGCCTKHLIIIIPGKTEYSSIFRSEHIIHNHLTTVMKMHLLFRWLQKESEILLKVFIADGGKHNLLSITEMGAITQSLMFSFTVVTGLFRVAFQQWTFLCFRLTALSHQSHTSQYSPSSSRTVKKTPIPAVAPLLLITRPFPSNGCSSVFTVLALSKYGTILTENRLFWRPSQRQGEIDGGLPNTWGNIGPPPSATSEENLGFACFDSKWNLYSTSIDNTVQ